MDKEKFCSITKKPRRFKEAQSNKYAQNLDHPSKAFLMYASSKQILM